MKYKSILLGDIPTISFNERTNLGKDIEKYWKGHDNSPIGLQYLNFKNGIIHVKSFPFERQDILVIQFYNRCNIFIKADGSYNINMWSEDDSFSNKEREYVDLLCGDIINNENEYIKKHKLFFESEPWHSLEGLTPEEAIDKLTSLGW